MGFRAARRAFLPSGRAIAIRYLLLATSLNLFWEVAQLPLYRLWENASTGDLAYAVVHCTGGDALVLSLSLFFALVLAGNPEWPNRGYTRVALAATCLGVGYAILSEWLNVEVFRTWAYARAMPLMPCIGTGLAPLMQ
jgi:hypothetical protein